MKKLCLIFIPVMAVSFLTNCSKKSLENYTWQEIQEISKNHNASKTFKIGDTKRVQLKTQDLNGDGIINNGECYQTVRIIGFDHDFNDDYKTIGITFEFVDKICDPFGLSLATFWNDFVGTKDQETKYNASLHYIESSVRAALIGKQDGGAELNWFRYYGIEGESDPWINYYFIQEGDPCYQKSVLEMLPDDLRNAITPSWKTILDYKEDESGDGKLVYDWIHDPLFLLSPREVGYNGEEVKQEPWTYTYQYYQNHTNKEDSIRIKTQMNNADANDVEKNVKSGNYYEAHKDNPGFHSYSHAGCRTNPSQCINFDWLRTPHIAPNSSCAYCIHDNTGTVDDHNVRQYASGVAPAFCI